MHDLISLLYKIHIFPPLGLLFLCVFSHVCGWLARELWVLIDASAMHKMSGVIERQTTDWLHDSDCCGNFLACTGVQLLHGTLFALAVGSWCLKCNMSLRERGWHCWVRISFGPSWTKVWLGSICLCSSCVSSNINALRMVHVWHCTSHFSSRKWEWLMSKPTSLVPRDTALKTAHLCPSLWTQRLWGRMNMLE